MKYARLPKRNRRIRKKLFVDEFAVYGFEVHIQMHSDDSVACDALINELVEVIEARGLLVLGGGYGADFEGFVYSAERYGSATEGDRQAIDHYLAAHTDIAAHRVGSLEDLYYGNMLEETEA